jgi:B-box zinc finger protein
VRPRPDATLARVSSAAGTDPAVAPLHCDRHPSRETYVSCSNCGRPICTDCMVQSAVGIKCRDCAKQPRSARASMKPDRAARAVGAAVVGGGLIGTVLAYLGASGLGFFTFIVAWGVGIAMGRLVLNASGRYRSRPVAWMAAGGAAWAYVVAGLWLAHTYGGDLRAFVQVLGLAIAAFVAYREAS